MKKYRTLIIIGAVVLVLLAAILIISRIRSASQQSVYETAIAERGTLTATIGATGNVRANQSVILTWQTSGMVDAVNVISGQMVGTGDVLAILTQSSLSQNILLAQADLVTAQKNLDNVTNSRTTVVQAELSYYQAQDALAIAQTRYDNAKNAYGEKSTSRAFLEIKANLALAQARVDDAQREYERVREGPNPDDIAAAQARVNGAEAALRVVQISAPFAGTVTETYSMPGDQVSRGTRGFRVDDLSALLVDVQVTEVDINTVEVGQPVIITFDAILGVEYHGEVVDVAQAGEVANGSVNFTITVELTDADARVKPGMTAAVTITVKQLEDVLLVPNRAVRLVEGQRVVYVQRNGTIEQIAITLGASSDMMSEIVSGDLNVGDVIILNPSTDFMMGGPGFINR